MSKDKEPIFCQVRREWVAATPEEGVRQHILGQMLQKGYPLAGIAVEKSMRHMPHLSTYNGHIPERRFDIVCFSKGIHPEFSLYPLLLVECKAVKLSDKVINQVVGYNHFVGAFFVCIVNQLEIKTGSYDAASRGYKFVDYMPSYHDLHQLIKR